jgi:alpha-ketoglutarate-dependent taurine dioxygenase
LTLHHIITDGWSTQVLVRELSSLYRSFVAGQPSPLLPLPIQYADYALWQREWLQGEVLESQLTYWKKQLAGIASLHLPVDQHRSSIKSHRGAAYSFTLTHDLSEALVHLSSQEQVTLFMTLLAAFQTLLHYFSGQDDIVVGTDVANRHRVEIEGLIGFFVNQLVLRANLSKNPTFRELLRQIRTTALEAYVHQELPFEKLVEVLRSKRSGQLSPLFQVKFLLDKTSDLMFKSKGELLVLGVTVSQESLSPVINRDEDLLLNMYEGSQGIIGTFIYNTDLFEATTIAHMARRFSKLIERICAHPDIRLGMLKLLTEKEEEEEEMEQKKSINDAFSQFELVQPRPVRLHQEPLTQTSYLSVEEHLPLVISPQKIALDIVEWAKSNQAFIEAELRKYGALLFRGFHALSPVDFEQFALALCPDLFQENGEHVPANIGDGNLYTPVFYPPEKKLLWHNENSFNKTWPMKILFFCAHPAEKGGETPIADNRKVFQRIDPYIREQFMQKGIMYIRNYGEGLGLPWQEVFRTEKREDVERYCQKADIAFEWKDHHHLKTRLVRPAVLKHPQTGEWLWWNQATHWHLACLEDEVRASLLALFSEEDLPRNCFYGDGSPIEDGVIDAICQAYQEAEVCFSWRQGDILLLDNMLTAHARNPYEGQRKIYVSMGNMVTLNDLSQAR